MVDSKQSEFRFENSILNSQQLLVEENTSKESRQVRGYNFSTIQPTPLEKPFVALLAPEVMKLVGLQDRYDSFTSKGNVDDELAELLSGGKLFPDSKPLAHCYAGHQFGHFSGQLGDGRAISLGDVRSPTDNSLYDLQLKGAGQTPFSRKSDGRAVLRSSIREFLCSEAMHHLGIPTTRAASLVVSDKTQVVRDKLYNGNAKMEKCAVVLRVAPTFLRFGSFEIFKPECSVTGRSGPSSGLKNTMMPKMLDYLVENFYPEIKESFKDPVEQYKVMFEEVVQRTAVMAAHWQSVGFCHGVLNTDNMSMLGLTIDFGPYGWMEHFNKDYICNHSDDKGRYRYEAQDEICKTNLIFLAQALDPVVPLKDTKAFVEANYSRMYQEKWQELMAKKLGFWTENFEKFTSDQSALVGTLFATLQGCGSDFTNTFRTLSDFSSSENNDATILDRLVNLSSPKELLMKQARSPLFDNQKLLMILKMDPEILKNFGYDPDQIKRELDESTKKMEELEEADEEKMQTEKFLPLWNAWLVDYKKVLASAGTEDASRQKLMKASNPSFILRNYLLQEAIEKAEAGDFSQVEKLFDQLRKPFAELEGEADTVSFSKLPPKWAYDYCVSCSS